MNFVTQVNGVYRVIVWSVICPAAITCLLAVPVSAECPDRWTPNLFPGLRGLSGVSAAAIDFDDGSGSRLYVGGGSRFAGSLFVNGIASWSDTGWERVGNGLGGYVTDFVVFDDGSGPALYATGNFGLCVGRWNGSTWDLVPGSPYGEGKCLAVQDFGDGQRLFVGGHFLGGNADSSRLVMWDGHAWHAVGGGIVGDAVKAIIPVNDEQGPGIYVAGSFTSAGPIQVGSIARWNGSEWSWLGDGVSVASGTPSINALHLYDDGNGVALYVGGRFDYADGVEIRNLARWDGSTWSSVGPADAFGASGCTVNSIASFDDGTGTALYVGGNFTCATSTLATRCLARLDGATWVGVPDTEAFPVLRLHARQTPQGSRLLMLGTTDREVLEFDGNGISPLGATDDVLVEALAPIQNKQMNALAVGGQFSYIAGTAASNIAIWDGEIWSNLGVGVNGRVRAACWFDNGVDGVRLIVGGDFTEAGGVPASHVAQWDGAQWSSLGVGVSDSVLALAVWNSPIGPTLIAAGTFTNPTGRIAQWDGAGWQTLGTGLNGIAGALAIHDDGTGEALYVVGQFSRAGGQSARGVARWNGTQWSPVGDGLTGGIVYDAVVFDDGVGEKLYAAGGFTNSGATLVHYFAKWDGTSWSEAGGGTHQPTTRLFSYRAAQESRLVMVGPWIRYGSPNITRAAIWNGQDWSALVRSLDGGLSAFAAFDDGRGPALFAGGDFFSVDNNVSGGIARFGPQPSLAGDVDQNCRVGMPDLALLLTAFGTCEGTPEFNPALDIIPNGCVDIADLALLLSQFGLLA